MLNIYSVGSDVNGAVGRTTMTFKWLQVNSGWG